MADFDKNLQPIIKETGYKGSPVPIGAGMNFSSGGGGGVSDLSQKENVFAELAAAGQDLRPKGIFISNAELEANKRYKTFNPTIGDYEDFAAQGQTWYKQAANGVLKGANLAATTVAGGFGMLYGVGKSALFTHKLSDVWDNEIMRTLDEWNQKVDNEYLPNYYTAAERNSEWYATDNWFTTNFLFDKLIKNAGFAVGAMVGGNIANAGLLKLGTKIGGLAAKGVTAAESSQSFKLFTPLLKNTARAFSAGKNAEAAALLESQISSIADLSARSSALSNLANISKQTQQFAKFSDSARQTAVAVYSSAGESSFEALQSSNEFRENLIEEYKRENGYEPIGDDLENINIEAEKVGKVAFFGNMALLSITEFNQLPYLIGSNYAASRQASNSLRGKIGDFTLDATGKRIKKEGPTTRFGKIYEGTKRAGAYVVDPKESMQEILQYGLQVGTQNYFKKSREGGEADLYVDGFLYGLFGKDKFGEGVGAFVSKEGIEGGILGGITGGLMQARGKYTEKKALAKNTEEFLNLMNNAPSFKEAFEDKLESTNRGVVLQQQHRDAIINGDRLEERELFNDLMHTYLSPRIKYGRFDMVVDDLNDLKKGGMTEQGLNELKEQGMANINDTVQTFQKRIASIETSARALNDIYQSLNIRYSGETTEVDGAQVLKYPPIVVDMLAYAGSKIANYDVRIPQLNAKITGFGINTQAILQDIIDTGIPNAEATKEALSIINFMDVTSEVKDELKGTLDDVIELSLRRKMFIKEYDGIKNNPLNYVRSAEEVSDIDVKQKEDGKKVTKTLEVGRKYSLTEPIKLENGKLVFAPKFTVLSSTLGGEFEVELPDGTTTFFSPEQFDKYNITEQNNTSQELEDALNQSIDEVLDSPEFKDIEKPEKGINKLAYINSLGSPKLIKAVMNRFDELSKEYLENLQKAKQAELEIKNQNAQINKQQDEVADKENDPKVGEIEFDTRIDTGETGDLKSADVFFNSSSTASDDPNSRAYEVNPSPSTIRARVFLNNAKKSKKRDKFRVITFTHNQEKDLGLSGIAELSYGAKWATNKDKINDPIDGFVAHVYVEVSGKDRYFIDQNGNRIKNAEGKDVKVGEQVDLGKVIFETRPTAREYSSTNEDRFRTKEKEKFLAKMEVWKKQRELLFSMSAKDLPTNSFVISKGFPITTEKKDDKYVKNKVGETLIDESQIENQTGLLKISTGTPIVHTGENMMAKPGIVYLQNRDTFQVLNNNTLGNKKAKTVYEVIKSIINEMEDQALSKKPIKIDRQKLLYLRSVLIYARPATDKSSNRLWIDIDSMSIKIGSSSYPFSEFASNEAAIVKTFSEVYHSANKKTLSKSDPYFEFVFEEGKLSFKKWANYQSYLLSGKNRSVEEIPFVTNVAKTSDAIPYNYRGKYSILTNFSVGDKNTNFKDPGVVKEKTPVVPPVIIPSDPPSVVKETSPVFTLEGITLNDGSSNDFEVSKQPLKAEVNYDGESFTITIDFSEDTEFGKLNRKSLDNLSSTFPEENLNILRKNIPALTDTSSKEDTIIEFFKYQILGKLGKALNAQQQAPPVVPVSDKKAEGTNIRGTIYKSETTEKDGLKITKYSEFRPDGIKISKGGRIMTPAEFIKEYNITDKKWLDSLEGSTEIRIYEVRVGKDGRSGMSIQGTFPEGNVEMEIAGAELAALTSAPVSNVQDDKAKNIIEAIFTAQETNFEIEIKGEQRDFLLTWNRNSKKPTLWGEKQTDGSYTTSSKLPTSKQVENLVDKYVPDSLIKLINEWAEASELPAGEVLDAQDKIVDKIKTELAALKESVTQPLPAKQEPPAEETPPPRNIKSRFSGKSGYTETRTVGKEEDTSDKMSDEDIKAFKVWWKKNVPNIPFEILDNVISINKTEKAWGVFENGVAKFFKRGLRGTEYHEIFEGIWKGFLSKNERDVIVNEFKDRPGYFLDRESGKQIAFNEATDRQVKERIADDFADYRLGKLPARTLSEKIKRFFNAIIDFFKNFVNKPSLKTQLFESIDSGRFKEAVLPDFVKTAQPEYRKQLTLPDGEILTYDEGWNIVQDMTISISSYLLNRQNDDTVSSIFELKDVTGTEVYNFIRDKYSEVKPGEASSMMDELGEKLFNELFLKNIDNLKTVGVTIDAESLVSVNDENGNNRLYSPEAFDVDFKKNMKFAAKFLISTQPSASKSKIDPKTGYPALIPGVLGLPTLNNLNRTFASLLSKLSNTSLGKIPEKLFKLYKEDGNYYRIVKALNGNMAAEEAEQLFDFANFKDTDWRLYIQFLQSFNKSKLDSVVESRTVTKDGINVISKPAERASAINVEKYSWLSNLKTLSTESGTMVFRNKLEYFIDTKHPNYPEKLPSNNAERIDFLRNIGINFPATAIVNQNVFIEAVNSIYKYGSVNIADVGNFTKADSSVTKLATMYVDSMNPDHDTTRLNVENKRTGNYSDSNSISVFEEYFNEAKTVDELLEKRPELRDVFSRNSLLIKKGGMFFNSDGNRTNVLLKIGVVDGITENDGGTSVTNLTEGDRFTLEINQNLKGDYYILIPADSSTERTYSIGNQIKFQDVNTEIGNSEYLSIMRSYLDDEIDLALDYDNREKLANTGVKRAKQLRFFKEILSDDLVKQIEDVIEYQTNLTEARTQIDKILKDNSKELEDSIMETVQYLNNQLKNSLESTGEVSNVSEGKVEYPKMDTDFANNNNINKNEISLEDYNKFLSFISMNQAIANIELHKFIFGDPYQFEVKNGNLDETKRIKSWLSPRRKTFDSVESNIFLNKEYNEVTDEIVLSGDDLTRYNFNSSVKTVTLTDPLPQSSYRNSFGGYKEADGFSVIQIGTFREVKWKNGEWSKEAEKWYQWQMAYTRQKLSAIKKVDSAEFVYDYKENIPLKKHDESLIKESEPPYVLEVLKPIVSGAKPNIDRIEGVIDKYSQMPIFFKAVEGTHLQDLYTQMLTDGVGYVVYKSGRKEGVRDVHDVYNKNGSFNSKAFAEKTVEEIAWSTYGIQLENTYEEGKNQTRGSQIMKNASMDMFQNGKAVMVGAEKLYDDITKVHNEFHRFQYEKFLKTLGIEDLGTGFTIVDNKKISETLQYELLRRDASENVIDAIRLDENGQFRIPFEASSAYEEIRNVLFSLVNKSLISPSMNGKAHVQVPVTLWEDRKKGRTLLRKVGDNYVRITREQYEALSNEDKSSVTLGSDTLKFYENEDGKRYMDIMIPNYWKKYFRDKKRFPNDEAILEYLNKSENQKILFGVGFRIPHQSASSTEIFKIKGFLHPSMGATVVVPSEIVEKAGSDFDIDKLNMYIKSVYVNVNGDVKLVEYKGSKEATLKFYEKIYDDSIQSELVAIESGDKFRDNLIDVFDILESVEDVSEVTPESLKLLLGDKLSKFYTKRKQTIRNIIEIAVSKDKAPSDYIGEQIGKLADKFEKLTAKQLNESLKKDYVDNLYQKSLENQYYELLQEMVTLPENFERLMSPVSDAGLPAVAKELNEARQDEESDIKNKLISKSFMTSLRHAFTMGKKWVGIAAVNITGHSIAQKINAYLDPARIANISEYDAGFLGDMSLAIPHNTVEVNGKPLISLGGRTVIYDNSKFISDRLSGYATAFVDVAKDPYIMKILRSDLVVGTAMFMERIGSGELTPYFLNQPIIIDYLKYLDRKGNRALFSQTNISEIVAKYPIESGEAYDLKQEFPIDPKTGLVNFAKSKSNLLSSININATKDSEFYLKQRAVFEEFLRLAKMAQFSFKFSQAYNYDTTRVRTTEGVLRKSLRTQTAEDSNIISSVDDVFKQTFIGEQKEMIMKEVAALSSMFKLDTDVFNEIITDVLKPFYANEFMPIDDFDRIVKRVKTSMIDYLVQNRSSKFSKEIITNLLSGKNNIAIQLYKLQKKYPNNELISNLEARYSKLEGGSVTVTLKAKPSDAPTANRYIGAMRELKSLEPDFYKNLVLVSLLQGTYDTRVSINKIVPLEDRAEIITPLMDRMYSQMDIQNFSLDGVFFRTNFSEESVVPTYSPKFSVYNGIAGYQKSGFIKMEDLGVLPGNGKIIKLSKQYSYSNHSDMDFIKVKRYQYVKGRIIDITGVNKTMGYKVFEEAVKNGELSNFEIVGYKKVKHSNGESLQDDRGNVYFKMVNLYGDGDIAKIYKIDGMPSSIPNNTFAVKKELDDTAIINAINANEVLIEEPTAPTIQTSTTPVAPTQEVSTPVQEVVSTSANKFNKKNIFSVVPQQGAVDNKAVIKASIATQYIGFGEGIRGSQGQRSSTEIYREQAGQYANTGNYSTNDVIFVSIPGKRGAESARKVQQDKTINEVIKALEAGATILTDNKSYIDSSDYNEGEKRLYKALLEKGYNYSEITVDGQVIGTWTKSLTPAITEGAMSVDAEEVTTDQYKYYGRFYEIVLDKDSKAINVVGYKGKQAAKQQLLDAYIANPNVDPQNDKPFRSATEVVEEKQIDGTNTFTFSDGTSINTGNIVLNEQQKEALQLAVNAIKKGQTKFVLRGYAGTGKSTISKFIREYLQESNSFKDVKYASPTHKANTNLLIQLIRGKIFNANPSTTASLLNKRKGENGKFEAGPRDQMPWNGVLIIDESSMIDIEDYNLLVNLAKRKSTSIVFMGDPAQLPPVGSNQLSKALQFTSSEEGVELTQVMRQKGDNPLLDILTNIRQNLSSIIDRFSFKTNVNEKGEGVDFTKNYEQFNNKIKEYFSSNEYKEDPTYAKVLTYTNSSVANYNNMIQAQLGLTPYSEESIMMGYEQVGGAGTVNNGQDYKILKSEYITGKDVIVFQGNIGNKYFNLEEKVSGYKVQMRRVFSKEDEKLLNDVGQIALIKPINVFIINPNDDKNIQFMERILALKKVLNDKTIPWRLREDPLRQFENFFNTYQLPADIINYKGKITTLPKLKQENPELFRVDKTTGKSLFDETSYTERPMLNKNIDYGYAVTSHKGQGSTYQYVFVDYQNMENPANDKMINDNGVKYANERQQLKYVGLSRASKVAFVYTRKADSGTVSVSEFESLFSKERQEEILSNFAKKHKMSKEEALSYIKDALIKDKEAVISKLNECY